MFNLDSCNLSGYISDLTSVKISKDLKRKYISFTTTGDESFHRDVCFSPEKQFFTSIEEQQTSNNIVVNNFTSAKKYRASFRERKTNKNLFH